MARRRGGGELLEELLRFEDGEHEAQNDDEGRANGQKSTQAEQGPAVVVNDVRGQKEPRKGRECEDRGRENRERIVRVLAEGPHGRVE